MERGERAWNRLADEREALIAEARVWEGTQREFAAAHGVSQSTVSKWKSAVGPRSYTAEDRAAVVEGFSAFDGSQREHDDVLGLPRGTTGKWVCQAGRGAGSRARPPLRRVDRLSAPTFLEVVPVGLTEAPVVASVPSASVASASPPRCVGLRLALPGGAELHFDALPPAGWVAELARELVRC